jgi:hypothetical protein
MQLLGKIVLGQAVLLAQTGEVLRKCVQKNPSFAHIIRAKERECKQLFTQRLFSRSCSASSSAE